MDKTSSADAGKTNEKKALSIVALVFGILGIISCWAPFFGLICCLVGVILGIVALVKKNQKGMAIAGLVCGAIGLIPAVIISLATGALVSFFGGAIDACKDDPSCNVTINGQSVNNNPTPAPTPTPTPSSNNSKLVDDIYEELTAEDEDAEAVPEDDMKGAISDYLVCLDKAGIKISSMDDVYALEDEDDVDEAVEECSDEFEDAIVDLYMENM
ncbi:DUF4190 domain-containing protein [Candidatus Saccharibacteria bacterium]|nr:DUF4190 domain-containing protein [Candidatus Saccharibacteria bacterium]